MRLLFSPNFWIIPLWSYGYWYILFAAAFLAMLGEISTWVFSRPTLIVLMLVKLIWRVKSVAYYSKRDKCGRCVCIYVKCSYMFLLCECQCISFEGHKTVLQKLQKRFTLSKTGGTAPYSCSPPQEIGVTSLSVGLSRATQRLRSFLFWQQKCDIETSAVQVTVHPLIPRIGHNHNQCYKGSSVLFLILMIQSAAYIESVSSY
jgi:hypothetical protein